MEVKAAAQVIAYLSETLQRQISESRLREQLEQNLHQIGLKDIAQRHPGEECVQCAKRRSYKIWLLRRIQHKEAKLMDQLEL